MTFIGNSHLLRGAFPRELAKMHFLCCLGRTETVWCITAQSKLKQTMFFFILPALLMWNIWVYKLQFTTVEEPGGLKDLMEQSVWISCRIFVRLELSTVVLLSPSFLLSLRPCGWLLHIYKSPGTHAYIPERARWVSLARLITFTSPRPVCSSQLITKHTLRGMIPLVCEYCSYRASAVTPHERAGCRWGFGSIVFWWLLPSINSGVLGVPATKIKPKLYSTVS